MTPSEYQLKIYDAIESSNDNLMIEAVAGSGKTLTIIEALKRLPVTHRVLFVSFNKHIADELKKRVPSHVEVSTLNSLGWKACFRGFGSVELDSFKVRSITEQLSSASKWYGVISQIISLMKASGTKIEYDKMRREEFGKAIFDFADRQDLDIPNDNKDFCELVLAVYKKSIETKTVMDFDDQIFMPVYYKIEMPQYDTVMVDESQDLSPIQGELIKMIGKRIICVGDSRQAIYSFRGADPESMANLKRSLQMRSLPLSICYRCPSSHVELASKIVPTIESSPIAKEGTIIDIEEDKLIENARSGDYVLCRISAPLVRYCLSMIADGKKAVIKGRDFGKNLTQLIKKLSSGTVLMSEFSERLKWYFKSEMEKYTKQNRDTSILEDKKTCIEILCAGAPSIQSVLTKIELMFSDQDNPGVTFSTVHKCKGLEADRIFILYPHLMPFYRAKLPWQIEQEMNLKYVALTRSKSELYFVHAERKK